MPFYSPEEDIMIGIRSSDDKPISRNPKANSRLVKNPCMNKVNGLSKVKSSTNNSNAPITPRKQFKSSNNHHKSRKAGTSADIWFDDVCPSLIAASREDQTTHTKSLVKANSFTGPTKRIAIDCEFVGVGFEGKENALGRVSIVNQFGHVLLDSFVRPVERVIDYRTAFSGIRHHDLRLNGPARPFKEVHEEVSKLCKGRILVGHSIGNDLKVLMLSHPRRDIRDTSRYRPFRDLFSGRTPSLRALTEKVLGIQVQTGEHDSVEDARATMRLYTSVKRVWESSSGKKRPIQIMTHVGEDNQHVVKTTEPIGTLNVLAEYEAGLDQITSVSEEQSNLPALPVWQRDIMPRKHKPWDPSRNRRCSRKREKFLRKRRKISNAK